MSIYEYDIEREMKLIRADERELGREEERKNTERERKNTERERRNTERERKNTAKERKEKEQAVEDKIKTVFLLCKEFGSTKEQTIKQVIEKCGLKRRTAEEKAELYWK